MRQRVILPAVALLSCVAFNACAADAASEQSMTIVRNGEQASVIGAPANFVGNARIDPLFAAQAPSKVSAGYVTGKNVEWLEPVTKAQYEASL
jgi:hypothetical protein